jgi:hypothetical protein
VIAKEVQAGVWAVTIGRAVLAERLGSSNQTMSIYLKNGM